jgi:hypothetical protein
MYPLPDVSLGYTAARKMVVDVVATFCPGVVRLFNLNSFPTEAAPKVSIAVTTLSTTFNFFFELTGICNLMFLRKMVPEALAAVANLATRLSRIRLGAVTYPCLKLIMLNRFVSLPIVLASKCLFTIGKSATVWF